MLRDVKTRAASSCSKRLHQSLVPSEKYCIIIFGVRANSITCISNRLPINQPVHYFRFAVAGKERSIARRHCTPIASRIMDEGNIAVLPHHPATRPVLLASEADTHKLEQILRSALEQTLEVEKSALKQFAHQPCDICLY